MQDAGLDSQLIEDQEEVLCAYLEWLCHKVPDHSRGQAHKREQLKALKVFQECHGHGKEKPPEEKYWPKGQGTSLKLQVSKHEQHVRMLLH